MFVHWSYEADQDVKKLWEYIAERNLLAADRQVARIVADVKHLEHHPHIGRIGRCFGTRELVIAKSPYIVAYRVRHDMVEVLRVVHDKRRCPRKI